MLALKNIAVQNKRLFIRTDLNVPIQKGRILNDARIKAVLPTIQWALAQNAKILLVTHLGRPRAGEFQECFSLKPIAQRLSELLHKEVLLKADWIDGVDIPQGGIVLADNVRFLAGEESNDEVLSRKMAALCDIYVMDAFASAHRMHASTYGVARFAPMAVAGPLLEAEVTALRQASLNPKKPVMAIVGGAKVSSKLKVLGSLMEFVDILVVGGGIANTFLKAMNHEMGTSLVEDELVPLAKDLIEKAKSRGMILAVPLDVVVVTELKPQAHFLVKPVSAIAANEMIVDIGPQTKASYEELLKKAGTVIWNGPLGVFEVPPFHEGTMFLAKAIAKAEAFSLAGGGETLAAVELACVEDKISYVSTGGGAFLEYLEQKTLPAIDILEERARS